MDIIITLVYILFTVCIVHPPIEFVSAGLTIPQLFDKYLDSENKNFIGYHMKRISLTVVIHSFLPAGYVVSLWCGGLNGDWMLAFFFGAMIIPCVVLLKVNSWWEHDKRKHPVLKRLLPYVTEGSPWRSVATELNVEYRSVDKVCIPLGVTSKFIATQSWFIKVTQYGLDIVKQSDCSLVATAADRHNFSTSGEDEIQYLNIEAIPSRGDVKGFKFRIPTTSLRDLQPRLETEIRVPAHITLLPTIIERFVNVFKQYIDLNPVYVTDQELELCIGCMQNQANVKLNRRCHLLQPEPDLPHPPCEQCNCRPLWCAACVARWWAARAAGEPATWLAARGSCPVCRARFCLLDACPARAPHAPHAPHS